MLDSDAWIIEIFVEVIRRRCKQQLCGLLLSSYLTPHERNNEAGCLVTDKEPAGVVVE